MEKHTDIQKLKAAIENSKGSRPKQNKEYSNDEDPLGRYDLLEKYGLHEMDEKDVDELLGSYDNDILSSKELESMERVLSKKVHQAIMSLSGVKKAAVEVYIDNSGDLHGIVNIIVEYKPKKFLDRILGTSNGSMDEITLEITRMEINEIFKSHPEIIENIEITLDSF